MRKYVHYCLQFFSSVLSLILGILFFIFPFCGGGMSQDKPSDLYSEARQVMVRGLHFYGITNEAVIAAMSKVRRHMFIPSGYRDLCAPYGDHPCPIGYGQTISQPYIVAYMTERLDPQKGEKVLEIGAGSGYQAAVLAEMGVSVYSVEIIEPLARHASAALAGEGYSQVRLLRGDGFLGWPEHAPYDAIIVTCAPENVPQALTEQLKENGRMIIPVGVDSQFLVMLRKKQGRIIRETDLPVRFVPMVHEDKSH